MTSGLPYTRAIDKKPTCCKRYAVLEQLCIPIQDQLRAVEEVLTSELSTGIETVDSVARYVIKNGGKRIRPAIFLLAARVAGSSDAGLPRIAASIEMLHTASLLHDDVVDGAQIRRAQPSANAKWGNQISVLVGDLLFCRASNILVGYGNAKLTQAMTAAIGFTTEGELLEIANQNNIAVDADTYIRIIRGKTAALFAVSARGGAIVAGIEKTFEDALDAFGFALGQAFQLADDALDYVADESKFGKTAGTDLREGKLTYPLIVALSKSDERERAAIRNALIAGHLTPEKFREIAAIIERHGGIEATWQLASEFASSAKKRLDTFKPSIERDTLMALADYAVERRE